jgi:hypothetical protein
MKRSEGIKYLTQCADINGKHWWNGSEYPIEECRTCNGTNDASHLRCFGRYGSTSGDCAPVAWRLAYLMARESGEDITKESLEHAMGMVVNESDSVAYIIREYGYRKYN